MVRKLDRVLGNVQWLDMVEHTEVEFLPGGISNHSAAMISVGKLKNFGSRPFKCFGFWSEHDDFLCWVAEGRQIRVEGSPLYYLYSKLRSVKRILKTKNTEVFGGLRERVLMAKEQLDQAQREVLSGCVARARDCLKEYTSFALAEESFLKQKSRNKWLNLDNQNTSYFHKLVKIGNSKNTISHLWNDQGCKVVEIDQMKGVAVEYYERLLGSSNHVLDDNMVGRIRGLLNSSIFESQAVVMDRDVTNDEILRTLFSMGINKAPGLRVVVLRT